MNLGAVIGLVLGLGILIGAAAIGSADTGGMGSLWDEISLAIVVGGAFAATCIAFPLADVIAALSGFTRVFKGDGFTKKDIVQDYVNLAEAARKGELGKALDDIKDFSNSFTNYKKGNDIKDKLIKYTSEFENQTFSNF